MRYGSWLPRSESNRQAQLPTVPSSRRDQGESTVRKCSQENRGAGFRDRPRNPSGCLEWVGDEPAVAGDVKSRGK